MWKSWLPKNVLDSLLWWWIEWKQQSTQRTDEKHDIMSALLRWDKAIDNNDTFLFLPKEISIETKEQKPWTNQHPKKEIDVLFQVLTDRWDDTWDRNSVDDLNELTHKWLENKWIKYAVSWQSFKQKIILALQQDNPSLTNRIKSNINIIIKSREFLLSFKDIFWLSILSNPIKSFFTAQLLGVTIIDSKWEEKELKDCFWKNLLIVLFKVYVYFATAQYIIKKTEKEDIYYIMVNWTFQEINRVPHKK